MGTVLSQKQKYNDDDDIPSSGNLGLSETEKLRIKAVWDRIGDLNGKREFVSDYLFNVMSKRPIMKRYFRLSNIDDVDLKEHEKFQTHIGNFNGIFRVVFEGLTKKTGAVQRKARQLGVHHRNFPEVKFNVDNWHFMTDCFLEVMKTKYVVSLDGKDEELIRRFLNWFFDQMHRSYELGEDFDG